MYFAEKIDNTGAMITWITGPIKGMNARTVDTSITITNRMMTARI